jgi:catechol 2,3-dioxygenase
MVQTENQDTYQATGTPRRLVHHNFMVSDVTKTIEFYNQVVGIEETFRIGASVGFLSNGNTHHDLGFSQVSESTNKKGQEIRNLGIDQLAPDWGAKAGLNHFAYEMYNEAELVSAYDRLLEFGVKPYLIDDRIVTRSVYFVDPEGNGIEYTVDMLTNWRDYRYQGAKLDHRAYTPGQETPDTQTYVNFDPEVRRVEEAALHAKRAAHSMIVAKDFASMRRFYIDVVGLREMFLAPNGDFTVLHGKDFPGYSFVLAAESPNRPVGVHHISFEMPNRGELDDAEAQLAARGVELEYKIEHPKKTVVCFRDPDDVLIQCFYEEPDFLESLEGMEPSLALLLV